MSNLPYKPNSGQRIRGLFNSVLLEPGDWIVTDIADKDITSWITEHNRRHAERIKVSTNRVIVIHPTTAETCCGVRVTLISREVDPNFEPARRRRKAEETED